MGRVLLFLIMTTSLFGQVKHAPTVAQCQADQHLWLSKVETSAANDSVTLPGYSLVDEWAQEMGDCIDVDPENRLKYSSTASELRIEQFLRLKHFLDRHDGLWEKFLTDDAAGNR
jgi:hypothetical protein